MRYWLGVVCRDHVRRGVATPWPAGTTTLFSTVAPGTRPGYGIAQLGHGKRGGLARLSAGDWLIYYSPRTSLHGGEPLQAFTAAGQVADDDIWQADEGDFQPWRRRLAYLEDTVETPVRNLDLELTTAPNWGHHLRRGLVELTPHDYTAIRAALAGPR